MKIGIRKRSYKKSYSAMTSGRYKRMLRRMVNPFYGKKGIGYIKNPGKALHNSLYHSLTAGVTPSSFERAIKTFLPRPKNSQSKYLTVKNRKILRQQQDQSTDVKLKAELHNKKKHDYWIVCVIIFIVVLTVSLVGSSYDKQDIKDQDSIKVETAIVDSENDNDSLIEGSKYDPDCKKAIAEKYNEENKRFGRTISISDIHWTGTQSEDKQLGKYKATSSINYGDTYRGASKWLCDIFVDNDEKFSVVIFEL